MPQESVDLVYMDPPFNSGRKHKSKAGEFDDKWAETNLNAHTKVLANNMGLFFDTSIPSLAARTHSESMRAYLIFMAVRLQEVRRILKDTGSLYLHCDPSASHYLRILLDFIFGKNNFRNEIVWYYYNGSSSAKNSFGRTHDIIHYYVKSQYNKLNDILARQPYVEGSNWAKNAESYGSKHKANPHGKRMHDVWVIPFINSMSNERVGYPTQKPLPLLERIIRVSSNEGNIVLDPFCGSGTTLCAAHTLKRQWIGIDENSDAIEVTTKRFAEHHGVYFDEYELIGEKQGLVLPTEQQVMPVQTTLF